MTENGSKTVSALGSLATLGPYVILLLAIGSFWQSINRIEDQVKRVDSVNTRLDSLQNRLDAFDLTLVRYTTIIDGAMTGAISRESRVDKLERDVDHLQIRVQDCTTPNPGAGLGSR